MRKRNVQILFRLTEEEAEHLNELVRKSGRSKEAFLREMVRGYQFCEKPDPEFYKLMRVLTVRARIHYRKMRIVRTVRTSAPCAVSVCMRTTAKNEMSYQALNLVSQIRLLGVSP